MSRHVSAFDSPPARPVDAADRIALLDVVRGFALWGVCLANLVPALSGWGMIPEKARHALPTWPVDRIIEMMVRTFVYGRFWTIFSFLFGLGFAVQFLRAEARGIDATRLLARRLAVLLGIGLVHAFGIWYGDILTTYAVAGGMLLVARRWPPARLLAVGVSLVVLFPIVYGVFYKVAPVLSHGAIATPSLGAADSLYSVRIPALLATPSYSAVLSANRLMLRTVVSPWSLASYVPDIAGLFLLGLWVGRVGLLRQIGAHRAAWRTTFRWATTIALLGFVPRAVFELTGTLKQLPLDVAGTLRTLRIVGQPAMSLAYVTGLVLLFQRPGWRARLLVLAPVGRMALTNYLTQSLLGVAVFYGVGFRQFGHVGAAWLLVWSIAIIAAQAALSRWWLARYRFGPAEWVWRSLTYGAPQPMRIAPDSLGAVPLGEVPS
jgi:uncharacterized protein